MKSWADKEQEDASKYHRNVPDLKDFHFRSWEYGNSAKTRSWADVKDGLSVSIDGQHLPTNEIVVAVVNNHCFVLLLPTSSYFPLAAVQFLG